MLRRLARKALRELLHEAGFDTRAALERADARAWKATVALERAQEETQAGHRREQALQQQLDRTTRALEQERLARLESEKRAEAAAVALGASREELHHQVSELKRQIAELAQANHTRAQEIEEQYGRRLDEREGQHRQELEALAAQHQLALDELAELRAHAEQHEQTQSDQLARRLAEAVQDTNSARQELMMVEVKLEVLEAAVNVLERRTRVAGVLPSLTRHPGLRSSAEDDLAPLRAPADAHDNGTIARPDANGAD